MHLISRVVGEEKQFTYMYNWDLLIITVPNFSQLVSIVSFGTEECIWFDDINLLKNAWKRSLIKLT